MRAEIAGAGASRPPPLSPPRKGEGDPHTDVAVYRLPPPCGEGLRVGVHAHRLHVDDYSFTVFSRKALAMTLTELSAIAAAASIGESSQPVSG